MNAMASVAQRVLNKNTELKYKDLSWNGANITVSDINECLQYITKGTAKDARIGEQIIVTSIRYAVTITGSNPTDHIRFAVCLPASAGVVTQTSLWPSTNLPFPTDVMRVYKDTHVLIDADTETQKHYEGFIPFKGGMKVIYNTGLGTMDKPIVFYTTSNHGLLTYPKLYGYIRIYYKDV